MKRILTLLISVLLVAISHPAWSEGQVKVHLPGGGETMLLKDVSDLAQLTTTPELMNQVWWPGAVIATPAATMQAQRDYQHVLQQLSAWESQADGSMLPTIRAVKHQLQVMLVTGRQFVSLDPDVVRTQTDANLRLTGDYTLYTQSTPSTVTLMGALAEPKKVAWQPGARVGDYLPADFRLSGADNDTVVVIYPDGRTAQAPVALWNARHVEAAPGSLLWVGFSARSTPAEFHALNQQIVSLLTRRVPQS